MHKATLASGPTGKTYPFDSQSDKPYSSFKPGQKSIDRDYYAHATTEKPDGEKCLTNFQRFGSDYKANVSGTVHVGDYKVPCKDANPMSKASNSKFCSPVRRGTQARAVCLH